MAMVEPCRISESADGLQPAMRSACAAPAVGSTGTVRHFDVTIPPSSKPARSVKVPPISMPTMLKRHSVASLQAAHFSLDKSADPADRAAALRQHTRVELPDMEHARPDLDLDRRAGRAQLQRHPYGVVAQKLIAADLNEDGRQARRIAIERRSVGMTRIRAPEIMPRKARCPFEPQREVGAEIAAHRVSSQCEIGPWGEHDGGGRKRQ